MSKINDDSTHSQSPPGLPAPALDAVSAATTYGHGIAPLTYGAQTLSAPAARDAVLETVKLNPGHAVAYRVY